MTVIWDRSIQDRVKRAAMVGVINGTELVRATAQRKIQQPPKTGKFYRRRGIVHQASAPGQPPATDTGRLQQGIRTEYDNENMTGTVIFSTNYAAALEFGTETIAPRPYARNSLEENRQRITAEIRDKIAEALR